MIHGIFVSLDKYHNVIERNAIAVVIKIVYILLQIFVFESISLNLHLYQNVGSSNLFFNRIIWVGGKT